MSRRTGIWVNAAVLLAAGAWQGDAFASAPQADWDVGQVTVHFGDLNLEQPQGVAVLYRRVKFAAERACGEPRMTGSFIISDYWRSCVAQAIEGAVVTLDRPLVTAYHRAHAASDQELSTARHQPRPQRQPGEEPHRHT